MYAKFLLLSVEYIMNKSITKFNWILKSIEISLVGWAPGVSQYTYSEIFWHPVP